MLCNYIEWTIYVIPVWIKKFKIAYGLINFSYVIKMKYRGKNIKDRTGERKSMHKGLWWYEVKLSKIFFKWFPSFPIIYDEC